MTCRPGIPGDEFEDERTASPGEDRLERRENVSDLTTRYMGLRLENPIIVSSSGLTQSVEGVRRCAEAGAGAVVLKSIFEEQITAEVDGLVQGRRRARPGTPRPRSTSRATGGKTAVRSYLELIREAKQAVSIPVMASIHCVTRGRMDRFRPPRRGGRRRRAGTERLRAALGPAHGTARQNEQVYFDIAREVTEQGLDPGGAEDRNLLLRPVPDRGRSSPIPASAAWCCSTASSASISTSRISRCRPGEHLQRARRDGRAVALDLDPRPGGPAATWRRPPASTTAPA